MARLRSSKMLRLFLLVAGFNLVLIPFSASPISPLAAATVQTAHAACTLQNPLLAGADPSVWNANGNYYLVQSDGGAHIILRASPNVGGLGSASAVTIWTAPSGTDHSTEIWAPEIERLNNQWIIYFAADDGNNNNHRIFAITSNNSNPMVASSWSFYGKVEDSTNEWAIDPTVFYYNSNWYMLWSGTPPGNGGNPPQQIYIAHMSDPLHVDHTRQLIANPDQTWETSVQAIEEGPEAFINPSNNKLTIVYNANASWTTSYSLGELVYNGGDMGYYASYTKKGPIFSSANGVYGVGGESLPVPAPFGYWMIYHAKTSTANGWNDRDIFAQPHTWNSDGTPNFGAPQGYASFDESTGARC